ARTIGVYENNMLSTINNHRGEGMNTLMMDNSARWIPSSECYTDTGGRWRGSYTGDTISNITYMPRDYAAVSMGFPNNNVYFPAMAGRTFYLGGHTNAGDMASRLDDLGFRVEQW